MDTYLTANPPTCQPTCVFQSKVALAELDGKNVTMMLTTRQETNIHLYWLNTGRWHYLADHLPDYLTDYLTVRQTMKLNNK